MFSQVKGAYVFLDSDGAAVILAFHKLQPLYLVFVYRRRCICMYLMTFAELLDILPIHSYPLPISLPIKQSLVHTIHLWYDIFYLYLTKDLLEGSVWDQGNCQLVDKNV